MRQFERVTALAMLDVLFSPRSVAIVGATDGSTSTGAPKLGAAALQHLVAHGFKGEIYPVNPRLTNVSGYRCYPSVEEIPHDVDLALILVAAERVIPTIRQCGKKKVKAAVVFSSGFAEAGEHSLEADLVSACREENIRMCGPNTAGVVGNFESLVASISMVCQINPFRKGNVAFLTQSGALGGSMLGRGLEDGMGCSHWVATGNEADLKLHDYMNHVIDDDRVDVLALFIEGIRDAEAFVQACGKAAQRRKPIVAYKTGLSEVSVRATASHTGAIAGSSRVFDAVCRQFGIIQVQDAAELLTVARTFSQAAGKYPQGRNVGIVSASGGICGVAADDCHRHGLAIPVLSVEAQDRIREYVPEFAAVSNPIDVTGQIRSSATGYQDTVREVLHQDSIDALLLLVTMAAEPRASFYGEEIPKLAAESNKPVVVGWCGATSLASKGYPMLHDAGIPTFLSSNEAVKALAHLARYAEFQNRFVSELAA